MCRNDLVLRILSLFLTVSTALPLFSHGLNIKEFGAVGDGVTLCTDAINRAISQCAESGGGRVIIPAGVFKSGTVLMKSDVELHFEIGSTLMMTSKI